MIKVRKCNTTGKWFYYWDTPWWWLGWHPTYDTWEEAFTAARAALEEARIRQYRKIFCSSY